MDDQNTKDTKEELVEKTEEIQETQEAPVAQEEAAVAEEMPVVEETSEPEATEEVVEEAEEAPSDKDKKIGFDDFRVGDTVRIFYKIIEGDKLRTQPYEGIVISKRGEGISKSFTVRRIGADGVGIERIFPASSPNIDSIKIMRKGVVRRAKLFYLRDKVGRAAMRIKEVKK